MWEDVQHLEMLNVSLKNLRMIREWNLFFDRGDLIRREDVESMEIVPLKYPAELENRLRRSASYFQSKRNHKVLLYVV